MSTLIHNILVGGTIAIIVTLGTLGTIAFTMELVFGGSNYAKVAKEIGAVKTASNLYEVTIDGERFEFGNNASSRRIKSVNTYFFVATAFSGIGYLGLYDRRHEMYGAKCHPDAAELRSGDAEFDKLFLIQSKSAAFAPLLLASAAKRETLRRLSNAGFTEIQFNDTDNQPRREQFVSARIPHSDGDILFSPDQATASLIRRAAKMLRELQSH